MSYGVKNYKETENKLHDMLYENINMLTSFYSPRSEFVEVFKKDMFVKNNKAAFYEVVYYLLNILNPEMTANKLTNWPPYDIKRETKFRSELLKYINELNSIYDHANIPTIMASHLISPGGFKIAKFIFKLTQLVIYEHLNSDCGLILSNPSSVKNEATSKLMLQNVIHHTENIKLKTDQSIKDFSLMHTTAKLDALNTNEQQKNIKENLKLSKEEYTTVRKAFDQKHPSFPSVELLEDKIINLQKDTAQITEVCNKFKEIEEFLQTLLSDDRMLQHDPDDLKIPSNIQHIVHAGNVLDLQEYFRGFEVLLRTKFLNLNIPTTIFLNNLKDTANEANETLENMNEKLIHNIENIRNFIEIAKRKFSKDVNEMDTLAVPIRDF